MSGATSIPGADYPGTAGAVTAVEAVAHGKVQGVGFRYRTRERAESLALVGSAVNLRDGSVRITAQGPVDAVNELIAWLRTPLAPGRVERLEVREIRVSTDLAGFDVG